MHKNKYRANLMLNNYMQGPIIEFTSKNLKSATRKAAAIARKNDCIAYYVEIFTGYEWRAEPFHAILQKKSKTALANA